MNRAPGVLNFREMSPADNQTELFCNAVAAEMLVPKGELATAWQQERDFYRLASYFKVSPLVVARRLLDIKYIERDVFFAFYNAFMAGFRAKKAAAEPGGNFYANCDFRIGRPFASAVGQAVKSGKLLYSDAYKLTGLQGAQFDRYVFKISGGGG